MTKSKLAPLVLLFTMIQLVEAMETDVVLDPRGPLVVSPKVFVDLPVTLPEAPESPVARGWPNYPVFLANAWGDHAHIPSALAELVPTLGEMLCNFRLNPALMPNAPQNGSPAEINAFALFGAWRCLALLLPDVWDYPIPFLIRLANLLTMPVVSVFCDLRPRAKAACVSDLLYFMANGKFVEYFLVCRGVDPAFRNVLVAEPEAIEFFFELCQDRDRGMQAALAWASTVSSYRTFKVLEDSRKKKMKTRVQNPGIKSEFVAQQPGGQVTLARQVFTAASREVDRINFQTLVGLDLWWWLCEQYENYLTYQIENWKYKNQPPLPGVAPATTPVVVPPPLEEAILDGTAVFVDRGPVDWDAADVVPYPDPSAAEDLSIPTPVSGDPAPDGDETPGSPEAAAGTAEPDPAAAEDLSIPTPVSGDPAPDAYGTPVSPETAAGPADPDPAAAEDLPIPTPVSGAPAAAGDGTPIVPESAAGTSETDPAAAEDLPIPTPVSGDPAPDGDETPGSPEAAAGTADPDPAAAEDLPIPTPVSGEPEGLVDRGPVDWDAADVVPYPDPSAEELPPTPTPVSDDPAPDGDDTPVSPETASGTAEPEPDAAEVLPTPTPASGDPAPDGDGTPGSPETAAGPAETETAAAEDLPIPTPVSGAPAAAGDGTPIVPESAAGTSETDPAAAEDLPIPTPVSGDPSPDGDGPPSSPEAAAGTADPDPAAAEDLPIPTPVSGEPEGLVDRGPVDWDAADVVPYPDPSAEELPPTPAPVSGEPEGLVDRGPVDWDAADVVPYPDPSAEELPPTPTPVSDDPAPDGDDTPVSPETAAGPAETETAAAPAHDPVAEGQPDGPVGRPVFLAETLGDDRTGLDAAVNSIIAEIPHIEDEDKRRFTAITAPLPFVRLLLARPFVAPPSLTEYGPLLLSEGAHAMALYLLLDCDPIRNKAVQFLTACQRHHGDILPAPLADFREFLGAPLTRPLDARVLEPGFKFRDYMKRELWLFYDLWRTNVPVTIYVGDVIKLLPILVREIALLKGFQARDLRLLDPYWYGRMIQLRKPIADVSLESLKGAIAANLKNKKS